MLPHLSCRHIFATEAFLEKNPEFRSRPELAQVTAADISRMSSLQTPQGIIGVFKIPAPTTPRLDGTELTLALDSIQNPGNLGTIIRLADWFGISQIIASADTADAYNPKVVQATMGSLTRVTVTYVHSLAQILADSHLPVIGTLLDGDDLYHTPISLTPKPIIVMGNEGNGISTSVAEIVTERLLIPSFPPGRPTSESLNVAMATGIILSELSRRKYQST